MGPRSERGLCQVPDTQQRRRRFERATRPDLTCLSFPFLSLSVLFRLLACDTLLAWEAFFVFMYFYPLRGGDFGERIAVLR